MNQLSWDQVYCNRRAGMSGVTTTTALLTGGSILAIMVVMVLGAIEPGVGGPPMKQSRSRRRNKRRMYEWVS